MFNLFEDPTLLIIGGAIVELFFLITLIQTGRAAVIGGIVLVAAIVGAGWAVEWLVVTDREAVEARLNDTARALEHNDLNEVLSHVATDATEVRERLSAILPSANIEQAKIRDLEIQVQANTDPKTARAQLRGIIHGRDRAGQMPHDTFMRRFSVRLRQEQDKWVITDYEELPQTGHPLSR